MEKDCLREMRGCSQTEPHCIGREQAEMEREERGHVREQKGIYMYQSRIRTTDTSQTQTPSQVLLLLKHMRRICYHFGIRDLQSYVVSLCNKIPTER